MRGADKSVATMIGAACWWPRRGLDETRSDWWSDFSSETRVVTHVPAARRRSPLAASTRRRRLEGGAGRAAPQLPASTGTIALRPSTHILGLRSKCAGTDDLGPQGQGELDPRLPTKLLTCTNTSRDGGI